MLIFGCFVALSSITFAVALFSIWTTYTFFTIFFGAYQIPYDSRNNGQNNQNNNNILHNQDPTLTLVVFCLADSTFIFLFVLTIRMVTIATMMAIAISPPIAAPMLRCSPIINVPIV